MTAPRTELWGPAGTWLSLLCRTGSAKPTLVSFCLPRGPGYRIQILGKLNLRPFLTSHMPRAQPRSKPLTCEDNSLPRPSNTEETASEGKKPESWSTLGQAIMRLGECRIGRSWGIQVLQPYRPPGGAGVPAAPEPDRYSRVGVLRPPWPSRRLWPFVYTNVPKYP